MLAELPWVLVSCALLSSLSLALETLGYPYPQLRGPQFVYRCDENRGVCVKTALPADSVDSVDSVDSADSAGPDSNGSATARLGAYAWSQRACQVRCGPAGALWPLPAGRVLLGSGLRGVVPGELLLTASPGCPAPSPRVERLLRAAFLTFQRRLQGEEAASRAQYARHGRGRGRPPGAAASGWRHRAVREVLASSPSSTAGPVAHLLQLDVEVCVETESLALDWSVDESYTLDAPASTSASGAAASGRLRVSIRAPTFFGARHALETLSQLVTHTGPRPDGSSDGHLVLVDGFSVSDAPAFPHRGLLLDTSRNYYSPAYIRATINAMAQNKLNVLHWHITDSQSFPYESKSFPQMSEYGSYSPRETYPSRTVRELSRFALSRGVRLLPELDVPAHVAAGWTWGRRAGLGDLVVCADQQPWTRYCIEPPCGQLNPANPHVYQLLTTLFREMLTDFNGGLPAPYFHMGGDEVHLGCWNSSREVVDYLSRTLGRPKRRKEDFIALWGHFQDRATQALDRAQLQDLVQDSQTGPDDVASHDVDGGNSVLKRREAAVGEPSLGKEVLEEQEVPRGAPEASLAPQRLPVILWTSELTAANVVDKYLDKDRYVIQLWLRAGDPLAKALVSKGYRVIVSTKDAWYLDHGFGNWKGNSTSGYGYHPWQVAYNNDPVAGLSPSHRVLGGEAAMWGEQADQSGASTKTWPRAAAVAERLWSGSRATSWVAARVRFVRHRDRMARLGTPSEAVQPEWCSQHEGECY